MATIVSVMYPATPGARFDMDYYLTSHMPMVGRTWGPMGLSKWEVLRGAAAAVGPAPAYVGIANLVFDSTAGFEAALAAHGAEIMEDVPNYTDIRPVLQVSETVGAS